MNTINKQDRVIRTLAESVKGAPMTRKVDNYEYQSLADMMKKNQVDPKEIREIFTDPEYYDWYSKRYFING